MTKWKKTAVNFYALPKSIGVLFLFLFIYFFFIYIFFGGGNKLETNIFQPGRQSGEVV